MILFSSRETVVNGERPMTSSSCALPALAQRIRALERRIAGGKAELQPHPLGGAGRMVLRVGDVLDRVVEGYIPGVEVALDGLLDQGRLIVLALFDKPDPLEGPFFEGTIYVTPSRLWPSVQDETVATTFRALAAVDLRGGPIHAELRINEAGPWIIDLAARSIGGLCSRILKFGTGMALEELILRHALRLPIPSTERESPAAGAMMIPIPRAGTLRQVRGIQPARSVPGVEDVTITIPVGQKVVPLPEGYKYLGFIFAHSGDPGTVEARLREAHRQLEFAIEPPAEA